MQVIGGSAGGIKLFSVPGDSTRPITARVKKSLFDILSGIVPESRFLDLFAGTGGVGIEALSRGASHCVFVEKNSRALAVIRRNLQVTHLKEYATVRKADVLTYVETEVDSFDIIYVAPPQYKDLWAETLQRLDGKQLLGPGGIVIAQIYPKEYRELDLKQLELYDQRKYGSTLLCFYAAREPSED